MRAMLKDEGPPPEGRWADLAVLQPGANVKVRHASTLLVFDASSAALHLIERPAAGRAHGPGS